LQKACIKHSIDKNKIKSASVKSSAAVVLAQQAGVSGNPRVSKFHVENTSLCYFNSAINSSTVTRVIKVTKLFAPRCAQQTMGGLPPL
jgi:hypothetical protein